MGKGKAKLTPLKTCQGHYNLTLRLHLQIIFKVEKHTKNEQAHKDIVHCEQGPINTNK